jgi:broad specificity phosphatase PhoE
MRLFIFARHAESAANTAHLLNSDPAHQFGLTSDGQRQAQLLGEQLAYLQIDHAVCSRFLRARQTIELALAFRSYSLRVDHDLDEVDAGTFDGAPITEYWAWTKHHQPSDRFPGGESLNAAAKRYTKAVSRLLDQPAQATLIVGHELALRLILAAAGGPASRHTHAEIPSAVPYLVDEKALREALDRLPVFRRFEDRKMHVAA